jgi:hypothetical protein
MSTTLNSNTLNSTTALSLKATNNLNLYGNQIVIYPTSSNGITFNNSSSQDYISNINDLVIKSGGTINLNSNTTSGTINLQIINNNNPTTYGSFSNYQGSLTINSNGGNINFGTYGYVNNANNGFTVSPWGGYSLYLNTNSSGTINLQNSLATYGTISNGNGLEIFSNQQIVISSNNEIYLYTGTLHLQPAGGGTQYGSFTGDSNNNLYVKSNNTIYLCPNGSTIQSYINYLPPTSSSTSTSTLTLTTTGFFNLSAGNNVSLSATGGNSINLDASSNITLTNFNGAISLNTNTNNNGSVTTNYVAPYSTTNYGIINQTALANIFITGQKTITLSGTGDYRNYTGTINVTQNINIYSCSIFIGFGITDGPDSSNTNIGQPGYCVDHISQNSFDLNIGYFGTNNTYMIIYYLIINY